MKSERPILFTVLIIVVCCGIGTAQECQIGCQSKIDALKNEVAALDKALAQQVPYPEKFNLTPTQQDPSHGPSAEQVLLNYLNVLLVPIRGVECVLQTPGWVGNPYLTGLGRVARHSGHSPG